jgi:hypothetical protein
LLLTSSFTISSGYQHWVYTFTPALFGDIDHHDQLVAKETGLLPRRIRLYSEIANLHFAVAGGTFGLGDTFGLDDEVTS